MATVAHEHWSSRFGFLMATVGFAVGLGNIWRFPYIAGENGGAAFVLVYLVCAFLIGVPILMAELLIGRRGGLSPPGSMRTVARLEGRSSAWAAVGYMNLAAAFLIEVVYCVITGWVLLYLYRAVVSGFAGVDSVHATAAFEDLLGSNGTMVFWTWMSLALAGTIIYAGVQQGIERTVRILMPSLFILLCVLAVFNIFTPGFDAAINYLFSADFSKITPSVWLAAVGQAFFSIGVGMAGMMTFGAYLPKNVSITSSVIIIICADTAVALLAGLVIFPVVFTYHLDPQGGPGLIFQTLPVAFAQIPGGHIFSVLFFLLVSVAAITSMVGLIEPITAWLEEHRGYRRHKSALVALIVIAVLSLLSILSYNTLSGLGLAGKSLNDNLDYLTNQVLLPLGGLAIALFAGWFVSRKASLDELGLPDGPVYKAWRFLVRWPVPIAIALIFVMGVGG